MHGGNILALPGNQTVNGENNQLLYLKKPAYSTQAGQYLIGDNKLWMMSLRPKLKQSSLH